MAQEIAFTVEKLILFFGTVTTFLLSVISFFLIRYVNRNDEAIEQLRKISVDHEKRIAVAESKLDL
mgnify:FL=1